MGFDGLFLMACLFFEFSCTNLPLYVFGTTLVAGCTTSYFWIASVEDVMVL